MKTVYLYRCGGADISESAAPRLLTMMSSASTPDFRASLRRTQRRPIPSQMSSSASMYGLSAQANASTTAQTTTAVADTRTVDPTFEPLERAGRAINDGIRKDDRFPELDQLVQRMVLLWR